MNHNAFTFQTLHPDTIMDALFERGIRVDSGLTPLNSYENRVYQFQDEDRRRYVVKFYRPERWSAEQIQKNIDLRWIFWVMKFLLPHRSPSTIKPY